MFRIHHFTASLLICASMFSGQAAAWQAELKSGESVSIDTQTHKPTLEHNGSQVQLWNGVHRLDNGSVIIVRDGIVVPSTNMYQTWSQAAANYKAEQEPDECAQLTTRVCGIKDSCSSAQACTLAKQLQRVWEDAPDINPAGVSSTGQKECHKGLLDQTAFPPCEHDAQSPAACMRLVARVCGDNGECQATPACDAARQLLTLAQDAHVHSSDAVDEVRLGSQCQDALSNTFFTACSLPVAKSVTVTKSKLSP